MKSLFGILIFLFFHYHAFGQEHPKGNTENNDSTQVTYYIVEGDTLAQSMINLDEVYLMDKLHFKTQEDRRRYLILRRKTRKVYPYAKLAAERLTVMNERLNTLDRKSDKRKYTKRVQRYVEGEFSEKLKNLTHSEGQILVKLIYRQTGHTAFELIKELRSGWKAFWYNTTANLFEISLKEEYQPFEVKEDFLIEDILQRAFREGALEPQSPYFPINYLDLASYWNKQDQ